MVKECKQHLSVLTSTLRGKRLKATPGRVAILDVFEHEKMPLSIKELKTKIGQANIDTATLYRNAEALTKLGLLVRVNLDGRNSAYELGSRSHHHHLVCEKCGKISDVKINSNLNRQALKCSKDFSTVIRHSLEFFGICKKCNKSN